MCRRILVLMLMLPLLCKAEDGSLLWLRGNAEYNATVVSNRKSAVIDVAIQELQTQWAGGKVQLTVTRNRTLNQLGNEGFIISGNKDLGVTVQAMTEQGILYGAFHLLRLQQTGQLSGELNISETPKYNYRILNHWDNLNGSIERGYAGHSLWKWEQLPDTISPRYREYARANASIGINGTVLNNVNASPDILTEDYLKKVKAIAAVFRPYGLKVYLSINFSSPKILGGLEDSDPLNPAVQQWWKNKVKEIYQQIPDFGGFLVKANSEGQPGPQDYGRTHADGANMLAGALKPYNGIVMWRAFVYAPNSDDRANQAYLEFVPLDGQFLDNVIIQVKNGPVDFQPREPFTPLFGAMKKTPLMIEFQITQEYLGFSNHLAYLPTLFKECLDSDTYCVGAGSTVAKVTDGSLFPTRLTAISGVANIGEDTNWTGHHFAQSNWYGFGRLAWDHTLTPEQIADEWIRMTFTSDEAFLIPVKNMMLTSRETIVNYMMPLGLHHIFANGHHYGPEPWNERSGRADWTSVYYHKADAVGLGFNRTTSGSNNVSQYYSPLKEKFNSIVDCPENLILWFHHVPWNHRMKSGRIMWDELCYKYDEGVQQIRDYQKVWDRMDKYVDEERYKHVQSRLKTQAKDAVWWKDACLLYFQTFSNLPIPYDIERPVNELDELKQIRLNMGNTN